MDVFSISANVAPKAPENGPVESGGSTPHGARSPVAASDPGSFEVSSPARRVEGLVATLGSQATAGLEVRSELVSKFRALMDVGMLDTPEAAQAAARAMVSAKNQG